MMGWSRSADRRDCVPHKRCLEHLTATEFLSVNDIAGYADAIAHLEIASETRDGRVHIHVRDNGVGISENNSSDLAVNVPAVRLLCTSGTPAASEVAAIARLAHSGWRIAVRADFDSAGLDHVATILTAAPGATPWRRGVADYVDSLGKAMKEEIRLERVPDAAWDPELSHVMREKGLPAYEEALPPLLLEDIAAGRPVATGFEQGRKR